MEKKLENCSSDELYDLLASKTLKLLDAINKKADSLTLNGYKKEVEAIQEIIKERGKPAEK